MKNNLIIIILFSFFVNNFAFSKNDLYKKIDLFGEVLENIKREYVEDIDQ